MWWRNHFVPAGAVAPATSGRYTKALLPGARDHVIGGDLSVCAALNKFALVVARHGPVQPVVNLGRCCLEHRRRGWSTDVVRREVFPKSV